jgi:hypothetical protein
VAIRPRSESRLRVVVTGMLAQYPLGGVSWDYIQYPLGLALAGHDVYYLEDTGQWPYNPAEDGISKGCDYNVSYLASLMDRVGLQDKWSYRFAWEGSWFGMSERRRNEVIRTADLIINVSGVLRDPASLDRRAVLCYIDSDPVFTQVKLARGQRDFRALVDAHDIHFSFGEALTDPVPTTGHRWLPTRQPIVLSEWSHELDDSGSYTTVMNWSSYNDVEFNGQRYGQKGREFRRFLELPSRTDVRLEVAMASGKNAQAPTAELLHHGWHIVDPSAVAGDVDAYRRYVQTSRAEWSVAKNGYVIGRPGWFSCRSACYLAAGRPVIAQDTGFGEVIPVGKGLFAFESVDTAVAAIEEVESDYRGHARAARDLAATYFDSSQVLHSLIERAMSPERNRASDHPSTVQRVRGTSQPRDETETRARTRLEGGGLR